MPNGLTAAEVADRVRRGLVNRSLRSEWRDYGGIVVRNCFTGFNAMVVPAAVALFVLGNLRGAIAVSGMAIVNTLLSLIQEIRAKIHLDRLTLLVESKVRVVRDGETQSIPAGDIVQDDYVLLEAGDAVSADGHILESQFLEIDEALLTGESDPVRRNVGDRVLSGSICVAGAGMYRADKVGASAFAQQTSAQARRYRFTASPATRVINRIVRLLSYTAIGLCGIHLMAYHFLDLTGGQAIVMVAATITTMVPQGMVLAATVSFIVAAIAMSRRGAIVQHLSAVETMAAIDVVCSDKTGTLTTNCLRLEVLESLDPEVDESRVREEIGWFAAASVDRGNRNIQTLVRELSGDVRDAMGAATTCDRGANTPRSPMTIDQIPFKSRNRYSAMRLRVDGQTRLFVLGAMEALADRLTAAPPGLAARVAELQHRGLRLLIFTEGQSDVSLSQATELPEMKLRPVALIGLGDEIRPDAGKVIEAFAAQGIAFKIISGDNPDTVAGTVRHLDLPFAREPVVSGDELARADDPETLILSRSVFGRVSPEQKVQIVETLRRHGKRVAMIGDGVNDVLPIKAADLGIAMGSGSAASKTVAGLVLENDRFDLLPETLEEGRTILRNLRRSGKLFLVKNVYSFVLILAFYVGLGIPFPYVPQQVTLMNWSVIGIPALAIAASRRRCMRPIAGGFFRDIAGFAIRTGLVFGLGGTLLLWHATRLYPGEVERQHTLFLSLLILLGITSLFRVLDDGDAAVTDGSFRLLGPLAIPVYLTAMYVPISARFFEMVPLGARDWAMVAAYAAPCWLLTKVLAGRASDGSSSRLSTD